MKSLKPIHFIWLLFFALVSFSLKAQTANVKVEQSGVIVTNNGKSSPHPSAVFDVSSNNKGVIFPKLSTAQRDLITTPAEGLLIYNTTKKVYEFFDGTQWRELAVPLPQAIVNAPSDLVVSATRSTRIDLSWTDNSGNETGFIIERKLGATGSWTQVGSVATDITTYSDDDNGSGLIPLTKYYYRIQSIPNSSENGFSNEASATTLGIFSSTWVTSNAGESGNDQIKLPLEVSGTYNFEIDWGDGSTSTITSYNQAEVTHTYATPGTYTLNVAGVLNGWRFNNGGDAKKLIEISDWGDLQVGNSGGYFYGSSNLVITDIDGWNSGATTNFTNAWRNCSAMTSFPLLNTANGIVFDGAWEGCSGLTSFPEIITGLGTSFNSTWSGCSGLTSFPDLNTSAGVSFNSTWKDCSGLSSFPDLDTSAGLSFISAWSGCSGLLAFPSLPLNNGLDFSSAWFNCSSLDYFPGLDLSSGTNFTSTWQNCNSLQTISSQLNVSSGTNFSSAWRGASSLITFPGLNVNSGTNFQNAWRGCTSLTTLPGTLNTSSATNFVSIVEDCTSMTSFPLLNTSSVTNFSDAWRNTGLTSFPNLDTSSGTNFNNTWRNCSALDSFPVLNMGAMTTGIGTFNSTNIGTSSYSALLMDIASKNTNTNVTFDGGNATYNTSAASDRSTLVNTRNWTITDGGAN